MPCREQREGRQQEAEVPSIPILDESKFQNTGVWIKIGDYMDENNLGHQPYQPG